MLFRINPGEIAGLRQVLIYGLSQTDPSVVKGEVALKPGERFDIREIERTLLRLRSKPMFADVAVDYEGGQEIDVFDLVIQVRERRTGRIEGGIVYGDAEGAAFQFNLLERNLAVRPPFRGEGLDFSLQLTLGDKVRRGEVGLTNPRIGDTDWLVGGDVFLEDTEISSSLYDQRSYGGQILAGYMLNDQQTVRFGYAAVQNELYNIDPGIRPQLSPFDENLRVTSLVLMWDFDNSNRPFRASEGFRLRTELRLANEMLGGNVDVMESSVRAGWFVPTFADHVLNFWAGANTVERYGDTETVPVALRRFLGGNSNLRGFDHRSISPVDEENRLIGGASSWWGSVEYLWPLNTYLDLALYWDVGDVSSDSFSFSGEGPVSNYGVGMIVRSDNFPVRFDLAVPLSTLENDRNNTVGETRLSFSVGYRYF